MYQLLTDQIQVLLNEEFTKKLEFGKYSRWAVNLTSSEIIPILSAIGHYGISSASCPDIDTRLMFSGHGLDQILGSKLWLTQEQLNALRFLASFYVRRSDRSKYNMLPEYSKESPHFARNVAWAIGLTSSDLFGIFWHVGGFGSRNLYKKDLEACINNYHPRVQECLICLMRLAQSQTTYYQLAGERYPLREN